MRIRVYNFLKITTYFSLRQWKFINSNVSNLNTDMSKKDQETFQINTKSMLWDEYVENYCLGVREHLMKQSPDSLPACRAQMNR